MTDVVGNLLRNFKSAQTREANLLAKRVAAMQSFSEDDLRMLGVTNDLAEEAQKLRSTPTVENDKKKKRASK